MSNLRRACVFVGILAVAGSLILIFHPIRITREITQGPPREIAIVWQSPFGPLGVALLLAGSLLVFGSLPKSIRLRALSPFMVLCSLALAVGFHFNDYHDWWWRVWPWIFPLGLAAGFGGGLIAGHMTIRHAATPQWCAILVATALSAIALVPLMIWLGVPSDYFSYSRAGTDIFPGDIYPGYESYAGDYIWGAMLVWAFVFLAAVMPFIGFGVGLTTGILRGNDGRGSFSQSSEGGSVPQELSAPVNSRSLRLTAATPAVPCITSLRRWFPKVLVHSELHQKPQNTLLLPAETVGTALAQYRTRIR